MRIKRGKVKNRKHKKILKAAKGYRLTYSKLYRRAKEALLHAGQYSYDHRKKRGNDFRKLWIKRINGALTEHGIKYNIFINSLKKKKIEIDRKMLSELAINEPEVFAEIVEKAKK
ncbi:MAG: 50S ribosomal protein L20 [Candidatus Dojkabacteria bacterium]|nr:50S ribosomal protein L20 [Candidatus Dojkabacteria bacterium]